MSRPIRRIAVLGAAAFFAALLAFPAVSGAATTCKLSLSAARSMGPTYVTQLKVTRTSCANGRKVAKAYHTCRLKKGKTGRCSTKVLRYTCTDRRPSAERIPTQYTGYVTCKRGSARVTHSYQQDT